MSKRAWDSETLPQGDDKVAAVRQMFDAIAPRYDLVNRIMTFRLDVHWRRKAVQVAGPARASTVIDLASGTGDLCVDLARAGHRPLSFDLSFGMLAADRSGAPRAQADILRLPLPDASVDGATCGFALRNLVELPRFFDELGRVVRTGGRIALLDVGVPHNRVDPMGQQHLLRQGRSEDRQLAERWRRRIGTCRRASPTFLPASRCWRTCSTAGFADAEHHQLSGGITQLLLGTRS